VITDKAGNTTVIWEGSAGVENDIHTAERPAGGTWHPRDSVASGGQGFPNSQAVLSPNGNITLAYQRTDGSNFRVGGYG